MGQFVTSVIFLMSLYSKCQEICVIYFLTFHFANIFAGSLGSLGLSGSLYEDISLSDPTDILTWQGLLTNEFIYLCLCSVAFDPCEALYLNNVQDWQCIQMHGRTSQKEFISAKLICGRA